MENIGINTMVKLLASNYSIWKPMMEDVLYCKDLHDPIEGDSVKPSDMSNRDWEKLNRKTIRCIRQCIDVKCFSPCVPRNKIKEKLKLKIKLFGKN